jgi:outer membrane receptor protein involved in Fe transport
MRRKLISISLVATLAGIAPAMAQQTTGNIVGVVEDPSSGALEGVTVSLAGARVMGAPVSATDSSGRYRFASLPPGIYELTFSLAGFAPVKRTGIRVTVGGIAEENVTLAVAAQTEAVTVQASVGLAETQSAKVGSNYGSDWIHNAPVTRTSFFDILAHAPGIDPMSPPTPQGIPQPASFGSTFDQNLFQLDGIDVTSNFGTAIPTLVQPSTDVLEEIEILSLGAPAEYGNVQGAVFNVVTRQGTNQFHGGAAYYHQSDGLTDRNTTSDQDGGFPFHRVVYRDFSTHLGGPVMKDKLWFFGAFQHQRDSSVFGVAPQFANVIETDHYFGKLNFQPAAKHNLVTSFNFDRTVRLNALLPGRAPETQTGRRRTVASPSANYVGILGDRTLLEARYAGFYTNDKAGSIDGAPQIATRFVNRTTGEITGAIGGWFEYDLSRTSLSVKLSQHASEFLAAAHDFKFGIQYNDAPIEGVYGINDVVYLVTTGAGVNAYGYEYTPFAYGGTATNTAAYVDDTVHAGKRLTLNIGVRYDHTHTRAFDEPELDQSGRPTANVISGVDYYTWNTISPRLGFNLKLTADGKTLLKGHYGRYYRGGMTGEFANSVPSVSPIFAGTWNLQAARFEDLSLAVDNSNQAFGPDIKTPYTDQFTASVVRELYRDFSVSAAYVHKRSRAFPGWVDVQGRYTPITYSDLVGADASGNSFTVFRLDSPLRDRFFLFTTPEGTKSDVNSFSLTAHKRMASKWQLTSSVVLTRSTGDRVNGTIGQLNFFSFGRNPNDYVNTDGLLARDRFLVVKTQALYAGLPWGFTVAASYFYADGYPRLRTVRIPQTNLAGMVRAEPRRDDDRFPSVSHLDLRLQKDIRLRREARFSLFADIFNLFNDGAYQSVVNTLGTAANYKRPTSFVLPRRAMLGAKITF